MTRLAWILTFAAAIVVLFSSPCSAWMRLRYEDAQVAERSELIVVGQLKRGTIKYVPHERKRPDAASWEHHATLVISEVLKGTVKQREIPLVIHYGLDLFAKGSIKMPDRPGLRNDLAEGAIRIVDTGSNTGTRIKDAATDNLWFLRRRSGLLGRKPGTGNFGIVNPEDIQPLALKTYFLLYLSDDPEKAITEYVEGNPGTRKSAERYLEHCEVQRILKIADPRARMEKLFPYFRRGFRFGLGREVSDGVVGCGAAAASYLRPLFDDPEYADIRQKIMWVWRETEYADAVPILIKVLKKQDAFWAALEIKEGRWATDVDSELLRKRGEAYTEVYYGVYALHRIGDPAAREVIEMTMRRWEAINPQDPQIVEACRRALKEFSD